MFHSAGNTCFHILILAIVLSLCSTDARRADAFQNDKEQTFEKGDLVEIERHSGKYKGKVIGFTGTGWPRVEYQEKGRRRESFFPPRDVKLIRSAGKKSSNGPASRKWKSSKGSFSVVATLVSQDQDNVKLKTKEGKVIDVPKTKLSQRDQDYLAKIQSTEENPFGDAGAFDDSDDTTGEDLESDPGESAIAAMTRRVSSAEMIIPTDNASLIDTSNSQWTFQNSGPRAPEFSARPIRAISHSNEKEFHNRTSPLVTSFNERYVAWSISNPFVDENYISVVDTVDGKIKQACQIPMDLDTHDKIHVLAIGDDGNRIVTGLMDSRYAGRIDFWTFVDGELKHEKYWGSRQRDGTGTKYGYLIGNNRMLCFGKRICLWDLENDESLYVTDSEDQILDTRLPLSPDGKTFLFFQDGILNFADIETGDLKGTIDLEADWKSNVAFSPDGKKLATSKGTEIRIWDMVNGEELSKFSTTAKGTLHWVEDQSILIGTELIDLRLQAIVWRYNKPSGGEVISFSNGKTGINSRKGFLCTQLPHKNLAATHANLNPADLDIIKTGSKIKLDINVPFSSSVRREIQDNATKVLEQAGAEITSGAGDLVLKFRVTSGDSRELVVRNMMDIRPSWQRERETVRFIEKTASIELIRGKEVIWKTGRVFTVRGMLHPKEGETTQQYVNRVTKATPELFTSFTLPQGLRAMPLEDIGRSDLPTTRSRK